MVVLLEPRYNRLSELPALYYDGTRLVMRLNELTDVLINFLKQMTKENPNLLTVPLEFKVACFTYKISHQEALQIFINYCTIYHTLKPGYTRLYNEALETIFQYLELKRPGTEPVVNQGSETQGCLLAILEEVIENGASASRAKKEVAKQVNRLIKSTPGTYYPKSRKLYLDEETPLELSKDFCAMCELYECHPAEILDYYMSRISIAEMDSRWDLRIKEDNCSMYFFMATVFNYLQQHKELLKITNEEDEFLQEVEEYRLYLYPIKNLAHRTRLLKEFYEDYYFSVNPNELNYAN